MVAEMETEQLRFLIRNADGKLPAGTTMFVVHPDFMPNPMMDTFTADEFLPAKCLSGWPTEDCYAQKNGKLLSADYADNCFASEREALQELIKAHQRQIELSKQCIDDLSRKLKTI
jgi:hypothetical protein